MFPCLAPWVEAGLKLSLSGIHHQDGHVSLGRAYRGIDRSIKLGPYVSESDIFAPNGNLSDIKNLVSFERELFEDSSYKYRINNSYYLCQYHHFKVHGLSLINDVHVNYMAITV